MTAGAAPGRAAGPARTIFFGSGSFAVPILDAVAAHPRLRVVAVVTAPDKPAGRSRALTATPVAIRARSLGIPVLQPPGVRSVEVLAELAAVEPELGVLADYGRIIPEALLDLPRHGILGVHPSLLPRHRGATPVQATILAGDPEAAVSVYRMDAGLDTGPLLATTSWPLAGTESAPELEADAARRGAALLAATIAGYLDGEVAPTPQPDAPTS
ncbi:MAG TPA: methionyl-tRNA formyltransferase, partial [Candidatus Limnocylindrales bacterium]|nr:methionyl-tRNA formyltransferase [Candidatus Limnocylindrales bacterium]